MRFNKYVNATANVFAQNRFYKFIVLCLIGLLISQQVILADAYKNRTVVLVPPNIKDKVSVSGSYMDTNYLSAIGFYVAGLMYNYVPSTVVAQYSTLSNLFSSENYDANSKKLLSLAAQYKENDVASNFQITGVSILKDPDLLVIKGEVSRFVASEKIDAKSITINIRYINDNGLFKIQTIEEK